MTDTPKTPEAHGAEDLESWISDQTTGRSTMSGIPATPE
jgi:hypothetical protein